MRLCLKFFDKMEWSMFGTLNVIVPLTLLLLFKQKLTVSVLIFSSIIGMMDGELIPRILFTGFINFMLYERNIDWVVRSLIFVASSIITFYIPYKNKIHKMVINNKVLLNIFILLIVLWMGYIFYLIKNSNNSIVYPTGILSIKNLFK